MNYKQGDKMTYEEAIQVLRKEQWKSSPDTPLPQWLLDKNNEREIKEFQEKSALRHEALEIAIESIKVVKSLKKLP